MEEQIIIKIENGIRGIRLGNKSPKDSKVEDFLERLKDIESMWYVDYVKKYDKVLKLYNQKKR